MNNKNSKAYGTITEKFISQINATLTTGTAKLYDSILNRFFSWVKNKYGFSENELIENVNRDMMVEYNLSIQYQDQNRRINVLISIRCYFKWLYEHNYLHIDPYELIKIKDIPRKIKKLPKPLAKDIDLKLINYLDKHNNDLYCNAFLEGNECRRGQTNSWILFRIFMFFHVFKVPRLTFFLLHL